MTTRDPSETGASGAAAPPPPRRLGIFLFHDPDGIVDDYVVHLLRDLRRNLADLIVVANGRLSDAGRRKLEEFTREIHVRPNEGFDVGAWREALLERCGFDRLRTYDELVLCNDSFFGPFYPFAEVFREMERRGDDFWGLSVHGEAPGLGLSPYGYRPRYLQTYFLAFGPRLLAAPAFLEFWQNQPACRRFEELAERFAAVLTRHFADLGFSWSAYCDTADLEIGRDKNYDPHTFSLYELVSQRRYPVLKRRSFRVPRETYLRFGAGDELAKTLEYVRRRYDFDLDPMFAHLLRRGDPAALKDALCLNHVLPVAGAAPPLPAGKKVAVVAHLFYPKLFAWCERYLRPLPPEIDLFVTTDADDKKAELERRFADWPGRRPTVLRVEPRGRDWGALLAGCGDRLAGYDYLGFVHDKKSAQKEYPTVGAAFRDLLWENVLAGETYVRNVVAAFEANPRLGLLVPPGPLHGTYFKSGLDRWTICYDETVRLAQKLGLATRIDRNQQPLAVGSVFWCRLDALKPLFAVPWRAADFPPEPLANDGTVNHALERILPFVAQSQGYLTGWVLTDRQAAVELANLRYMLDETRRALDGTPGLRFATFAAFRKSLATLRRTLRLTGLGIALDGLHKLADFAIRRSSAGLRRWGARWQLRATESDGAAR